MTVLATHCPIPTCPSSYSSSDIPCDLPLAVIKVFADMAGAQRAAAKEFLLALAKKAEPWDQLLRSRMCESVRPVAGTILAALSRQD